MATPTLRFAALALMTVLAAAASPAQASVWTTSQADVTIGSQYFDNDVCQPECIVSFWWYEESNGYAGLQRHDEVVDDTHKLIESDTIIAGYLITYNA